MAQKYHYVSSTSSGIKVRLIDLFSDPKFPHGITVESSLMNMRVNTATDIPQNAQFNINLSHVDLSSPWVSPKDVSELAKNYEKNDLKGVLQVASFLALLEQAGQQGVKIVNYSVSGQTSFKYEEERIKQILNKYDMLLVVAAGNEGDTKKMYPCAYPNERIVCVGAAYLENGKIYPESYSSRGDHVTFYSSGKNYLFGLPGTSFAAPRVTAALVMVLSNNPSLSMLDSVNYLKKMSRYVATEKVVRSVQRDIQKRKKQRMALMSKDF